jgi:hypothetical protein
MFIKYLLTLATISQQAGNSFQASHSSEEQQVAPTPFTYKLIKRYIKMCLIHVI